MLEFDWIDHHAPSLKVLFIICSEIIEFFSKDIENIVAVNCRAGKGRTGTLICCFLLFCGMFETPEEAMNYYSKKRFSDKSGITQPSQKRYISYFHTLLKSRKPYPLVRNLVGIFTNKLPECSEEGSIKAYFEIFLNNGDKVIPLLRLAFLTNQLLQRYIPIKEKSQLK